MQDLLVSMEGIEKFFPGVHALSNARFDLYKGEVHALLGENGAGKSTLMKILTGVYSKDAGNVKINGKDVEIQNPRHAQELGIGIVHQEFNLLPHLTVAENVFIGRESRQKGIGFLLNAKLQNQKTQEILDMMHLKLRATDRVGGLTVAQQQMVEIAKALSFESEVLILDEPTAALTESEIIELFRIIHNLRDRGVGIVYISHRLEELRQITDRVTVMRDGSYIDTVNMKDVSIDTIINLMVGREIYESAHTQTRSEKSEVLLKVENLNAGRMVKDVCFELNKGEILGFAGLMGAGRTEVARAIFGADKKDSGDIYISGEKVQINSPHDAIEHGIGYLSEDRKRYGCSISMSIKENIVMADYSRFSRSIGLMDEQGIVKETQKQVDAMSIKTPSVNQLVRNLSGGNQQKVIIGKWLCKNSRILIFDEPTRGIDVGAKGEIYKLLNDLVEQGTSIIMISSELPEILRMSHRIMVMCEGRITGILNSEEADQERIMAYATQRR